MTTPHDPAHSNPDVTDPSSEIVDAEVVTDAGLPAVPPGGVVLPPSEYTEAGVPTFDFVRDKIENRISTAIGSQELAEATPEGRQVDEMVRKRDEAAKKKLDEIRKSMGT